MRRSLRSWLWRVSVDREVSEELAFHLEMKVRELVELGMDEKAAREIAAARLGNVSRLTRACVGIGRRRDREMRITQWIEECRDDVRFALRQMQQAPGFALVAVLTLALGIGANSAMFALADATLLRPLPFPEPGRLVMLSEQKGDNRRGQVNPADFLDWSERNRTFTDMAAFVQSGGTVTYEDGLAESVPGQAVTLRFFDALGVKPIAGRTFTDADALGPPVVVLGEGFWRSQFGGDPAVIGRPIRLEGRLMTIIGIVPADFGLDPPEAQQRSRLWRLMDMPQERGPAQRYAHYLRVIGRLRPDATIESATEDLALIAESLAREWPSTNAGHGVAIDPLRAGLVTTELRLTSLLFAGVVGFVLLMCCANVANLLLARTASRARELAVRSALGAGRVRIMRQILVESLVLATVGGLAGAAVGAAILRAAPSWIPSGLLPSTVALAFDGRVLAFCAIASLTAAIAFGVAPAWQATGTSLTHAIAFDGRTTTTRRSAFRSLLAGAQVAAAVLLLCGAGLLLRTLVSLEDVDAGHRTREALTTTVGPGMGLPPDAMRRFYESIEEEIRSVPGVRKAAWGSALPFDGVWYGQGFDIVGDPPRPASDRLGAAYQIVSHAYFDTLGIPMLAGRPFTRRDTADGAPVCIVNEAFVRRYLNGRDPIGMRLAVNAMSQPPQVVTREIVGVVAQVKERPDEIEPQPHIYVPLAQNPWWMATLVVQPEDGPAAALAPEIRAAVARVDRDRALTSIRTMTMVETAATARPRFRAVLVGTFAGLALLLAMVGVFGVLACSVAQRTREFGVRMALGATPGDVLRHVLASAARVTVTGAVLGLLAAAALGQWMTALLFGVKPVDPLTFLGAAAILVLTAAMAAAAPALRAARVDPVVAFRDDG